LNKRIQAALNERGRDMLPEVESIFANWRKTHNDGVFDAYSKEMRTARKAGVITGLPDNYARGRIIGDYRRVALYGVDALIALKQEDKEALGTRPFFDEDTIRLTEEVSEQVRTGQQTGQRTGQRTGQSDGGGERTGACVTHHNKLTDECWCAKGGDPLRWVIFHVR